ncbi:hypothetical protein OQA88_6481 [Cercophora sp. LCS_1]
MSSRLTVPISKFTRSISTTPSIARPTHLLNNGAKAATASGPQTGRKSRAPKLASSASAEDSPSAETTRAHSTASTPHRPVPSTVRTVPLMQGFRTSAPKSRPNQFTASPLDSAILPDLSPESSGPDPFFIRVPLLPDNRSPPAGTHLPEAADAPLPRAEISVVAANPDLVLPSALTEVEGMGVDGVELKFAHDLHREPDEEGQGMLRDIWKGLVDDVFGDKKSLA